MSKYVSIEEEKAFIRLDTDVKDRVKLLTRLKKKFGKLFENGYKFHILTPKPSKGRFCPDWEAEAYLLAEKYLTRTEIRRWEKKMNEKYPPTPVATSFVIPRKQKGK